MDRGNRIGIIRKGAVFSDCGQYRYRLWRTWNENKPVLLFIMLNPSTADEKTDDPTLRRCISFANAWGYGGVMIANLYAFRASKPEQLWKANDPVGPLNQQHLVGLSKEIENCVCAWGNKQGRKESIISLFQKCYYLELSKDGTPKHPLYLKRNLNLIPL